MTHTDGAPIPALGHTREDLRFRGWTFIETKFCDVKAGHMHWITELKVFRGGDIEKLWFAGRHDDAPFFWTGKIPAVA